jgi:hypothetical protein
MPNSKKGFPDDCLCPCSFSYPSSFAASTSTNVENTVTPTRIQNLIKAEVRSLLNYFNRKMTSESELRQNLKFSY